MIYYNARYYVPSIGRFASADTIVPDPTNPQSANRYTYVLGNPVRLVDPSGHCGADALEGLLTQCEGLRDEIEGYYHITITGSWTLQELEILQLSLGDLESGLGGQSVFHEIYANTNYNRIREWQGPNDEAAHTTVDGSQINMFNATFALGKELTRWIGIHESIHVWDVESGYELTASHASSTNARCRPNTQCGLALGDPPGAYVPGGNPVSRYASTNPIEDTTESMTAYFFQGDIDVLRVQAPTTVADPSVSPERYQWAGGFIYQWKWLQENHGR